MQGSGYCGMVVHQWLSARLRRSFRRPSTKRREKERKKEMKKGKAFFMDAVKCRKNYEVKSFLFLFQCVCVRVHLNRNKHR